MAQNDDWGHIPVLFEPTLEALAPRSGGRYIDGTLGSGGHAQGILARSAPDGHLLGIDADPAAIQRAAARLAPWGERVTVRHGNFRDLGPLAYQIGWTSVDGILLDLGVSSVQLDTPQRGFSFQADAPLDMRMDPTQSVTAATLVNSLSEHDLSDILWQFGDERHARRIARRLVAARHITTIASTAQLARLVAQAGGASTGRIHPATRTFQALRIAVNGELEALRSVLPQAVDLLAIGGHLAIISFHSLEDRLVKQFIQQETRQCICPLSQPICTCSTTHRPRVRPLFRGVLQPSAAEQSANRRARSARLRAVERIA